MAQLLVPPPRQVMAAAIESTSSGEDQLPNKGATMTWKPRKEYLLKNLPNLLDSESEESEFSDTSRNENDVNGSPDDSVHTHSDGEDLGDEVFGLPEAVTFPELQTAAVHEAEDWDKELEDSESNPYDAGDFHCGSFQENNFLSSYSWQEDWFYNPGCHHAACLTFTPPARMTETGQFDDADE